MRLFENRSSTANLVLTRHFTTAQEISQYGSIQAFLWSPKILRCCGVVSVSRRAPHLAVVYCMGTFFYKPLSFLKACLCLNNSTGITIHAWFMRRVLPIAKCTCSVCLYCVQMWTNAAPGQVTAMTMQRVWTQMVALPACVTQASAATVWAAKASWSATGLCYFLCSHTTVYCLLPIVHRPCITSALSSVV